MLESRTVLPYGTLDQARTYLIKKKIKKYLLSQSLRCFVQSRDWTMVLKSKWQVTINWQFLSLDLSSNWVSLAINYHRSTRIYRRCRKSNGWHHLLVGRHPTWPLDRRSIASAAFGQTVLLTFSIGAGVAWLVNVRLCACMFRFVGRGVSVRLPSSPIQPPTHTYTYPGTHTQTQLLRWGNGLVGRPWLIDVQPSVSEGRKKPEMPDGGVSDGDKEGIATDTRTQTG